MSIKLQIFIIILLLLQNIFIIHIFRKKKLSIKYVTVWLLLIVAMIVITIFPNMIFYLSKLLGFEKTVNMVFLLGFFFLLYISFIITTWIENQNKKINKLIQEISIMKESEENNERK